MEKQPRYSGGIETRTESDETTFERERCRKSAEKLKKLGVLIPASSVTLYHGRKRENGNLRVNPFFNNTGDATNNDNINKGVPALHTSSTRETAQEYARVRSNGVSEDVEVAEIEVTDPEGSFFNLVMPAAERAGHEEEVQQALAESLPDPIIGTPLSLEDYESLDREQFQSFIRHINRSGTMIDESKISKYAKRLNISEEGMRRIAGSVNAKFFISRSNNGFAAVRKCLYEMLDNEGDITLPITVNGEEGSYPINREYLLKWMRDMHIIGVKLHPYSATLGRNLDDAFIAISLEDVKSKEQLEGQRRVRQNIFGGATKRIHELLHGATDDTPESPLNLLNLDRRAAPSELIASAKKVSPQYEQLYESDTGVKEHLTLEEHTETALTLFDTSFRSFLPRSIFDLGRLCLLLHDIGKPIARQNGESQEDENAHRAEQFLKDIGAPQELIDAIPDIITIGMQASGDNMLRGTPETKQKLADVAAKIVQKLYRIGPESPNFDSCVKTICRLCHALSTCDGGAYTSHAVTARRKEGVRHHNGNPNFDATFQSAAHNPSFIRARKPKNPPSP